jgi:hypothetical protein
MAACVATDPMTGNLYLDSSTSLDSCAAGVLFSASDYEAYLELEASSMTVNELFAFPEPEQAAELFAYAFSLVMICYLSAYALGVVVNFFNPSHERYN